MTHNYQGKDLPAPHSPACTAAPGPCICTSITAPPSPPRPRVLSRPHLTSVTIDPNGLGLISMIDTDLETHTTITEEDGTVAAIFDQDGTLTGGKIHRLMDVYKGIVVSARNENRILLRTIARENRNTKRTIAALGILSAAGWLSFLARGIWGF